MKNYNIKYQEVIDHEFEIEAESIEAVEEAFSKAAENDELNWAHGEIAQSCITTVSSEDGKERKTLNQPFTDNRPNGTIKVPLSDGYKIVACVNSDRDYKEIFIFLEAPDGTCHQDLAVVGEEYEYADDNESDDILVIPHSGEYSVKIYGDCNDEDWTEETIIDRYEE